MPFLVIGNRPLLMLTIFTPGGLEAGFPDMVEKNLQIPQDMQQVARNGSQYHMDFTGPPLSR